MDYKLLISIIFGVLPSIIWLLYYLTKDIHPEPKKMIMQVFLWGAIITIPVYYIQIILSKLLEKTEISLFLQNIILWFIIVSASEELFKYLVIKIKVIDSPHLDEPVDAIIYMIVSALGFAAVENILYLTAPTDAIIDFNQLINVTLIIDFIRFVGATFLHTLCSAVIGYSLAISFCQIRFKKIWIASGIITAIALHGLYDFSIMTLSGHFRVAIPITIILTLAFLVFTGFENLKKMKSICKVN
jgi:protease PrsW